MISARRAIRGLIEERTLRASAPCRIDAGGTWDIKAMALPFEAAEPTTVNIALDLRTSVTVSAHREGLVKITSRGFEGEVEAPSGRFPLRPPFGAYFAAAAHFGVDGIHIHIDSASPVKSALGGSSAALVALIRVLGELARRASGGGAPGRQEILLLAYHLEDALQGGCGGMQDQAAAVFGGVSEWRWAYSRPARPFTRKRLLDGPGRRALNRRMLVAFSGQEHVSVATNRKWVEDFLEGTTRDAWLEANRAVSDFARAIEGRDWAEAARHLRREMGVRRGITPEALIPETEALIDEAEACACGARFAGAGAGGSLWAIGPEEAIDRLRIAWRVRLAGIPGGQLLDCVADGRGVRIETVRDKDGRGDSAERSDGGGQVRPSSAIVSRKTR